MFVDSDKLKSRYRKMAGGLTRSKLKETGKHKKNSRKTAKVC